MTWEGYTLELITTYHKNSTPGGQQNIHYPLIWYMYSSHLHNTWGVHHWRGPCIESPPQLYTSACLVSIYLWKIFSHAWGYRLTIKGYPFLSISFMNGSSQCYQNSVKMSSRKWPINQVRSWLVKKSRTEALFWDRSYVHGCTAVACPFSWKGKVFLV